MSAPRRALLLGALASGLLLAPVAGASATSPWWQLTTSSRPTNLWEPASELQEFNKGPGITLIRFEGENVACMGGSACTTTFSLPNDETAAQLQSSLEGPYGAGEVQVSEDPEKAGRFLVSAIGASAGRYVTPITAVWTEDPGTERAKILTEGGSGRLVITATNLGDAALDATKSHVVISDTLPAGVTAHNVEGFAGEQNVYGPLECEVQTTSQVSCTYKGKLPPYETLELEIFASLQGEPPLLGEAGEVTISGGGAEPASAPQSVHASPEETPFGIETYEVAAEAPGGAQVTQAGSHPFQLTATIQLNQGPLSPGPRGIAIEKQPAQPRNFRFRLPPGLAGDATGIPRCSFSDFTTQDELINQCPPQSAVGAASVTIIEPLIGFLRVAVPVFNLEPINGEPARFGFMAGGVPVTLDASVRSSESYRVQVHTDNASQLAQLLDSSVTFWGNPGDPRHDVSRGWNCVYAVPPGPCSRPPSLPESAFLRLPGSCGVPLGFPTEMEPWNVPLGAAVISTTFTGSALDGCNKVPFAPTIDVQPDSHSADSPSGLSVHLKVPQAVSEAPEGVAESDLRLAKVTLPAGLQVNPAAANGLAACSEAEVGFQRVEASGEVVFDEAPAACPPASKLGTVKVSTPLLEEPVEGAVYQAAQGQNPFGSLLAFYIVAEAPHSGVRVKLASKVEPTPQGLISTTPEAPQLPFEEFELDFFGGPGAALATSECGSYVTETELGPWSGNPPATPSSAFAVTSGPTGGPCQSPEPFAPSLTAGSQVPIAGAFSPFLLRVSRQDGMQRLGAIEALLPAGISGRLAGVPYCPEAAIARAASLSAPGDGAVELASPSCPAASQVATVRVAAGVGPSPFITTGKAYLAGPYKGAPLSLEVITPAIAGPFDLGSVAVRTALYVDQRTAQITAKSDPLPSQLQGIALSIRSVAVRTDRPNFTLNPTSCEPKTVTGAATSLLGQSAAFSSPFGLGACKALGFAPKLKLSLKGGTKRNDHPALKGVFTERKGDANPARLITLLPPSEQIDSFHINNPCTRPQFEAGQCPSTSVLGHAVATSPLLDRPLEGAVYFRANGGERPLPDIVADLNGQLHVVLVGQTDAITKHGSTQIRTTFAPTPDVPASKVVLSLFGGPKRGLLVNNRDICAHPYKASVKARAWNGRTTSFSTPVANSCKRPPKKKRGR